MNKYKQKGAREMINLKILAENPDLAKSLKLEITGADLMAFGEAIYQRATEEGKIHVPKEREEYLTAAQMTEILQVSLVTIWSWDRKGITNPIRIGNAKRYRKSDLEKLLKKTQ